MGYRVRRIIMVNIGTPRRGVSQRITEIDPRGGAAVIGPNGVGKTTTLRLIPLFYGALPSTLVSKIAGQSGMIPFVLPSTRSALVFEYQRGEDDDDVRMVVLRERADGSESAEYRLFRCGFRRDLFIKDEHFLDDEGSIAAAKDLAVQHTEKLTAAEYRHVILGIKAQNQRQVQLRRLSMDYALGPKPLTNLDKLVAAMVKDDVSFSDLIDVAVGMVLEKTGTRTEDRDKVALRQSKRQIHLWIQDRRACAEARRLSEDATLLRGVMDSVREHEAALREFHGESQYLVRLRREEVSAASKAIGARTRAREEAIAEEEEQRKRLDATLGEARARAQAADSEHATAALAAKEFEREGAQRWAQKLQSLPALAAQLSAVRTQLSAMTAKTASIDLRIEAERRALTELQQRESEDRPRLEKPIRDQLATEVQSIQEEESAAGTEAGEQYEARASAVGELLDVLTESRGAINGRIADPRVNPVTAQAVETAEAALGTARAVLVQAVQANGKAQSRVGELRSTFAAADSAVQQAGRQERDAQASVDAAKALLSPGDGSLLATLKASDPDNWQPGLAKILDPELLGRCDLAPAFHGSGHASAFGWTVNTDSIDTPQWADDERQRAAVAAAEQALAGAEALVARRRTERDGCSAVLSSAQTEQAEAGAKLAVAEQKVVRLETELAAARERRGKERVDARRGAEAELAEVNRKISDLRQQQASLKREFQEAASRRKASFESRRKDAGDRHNRELQAVEAGIQSRLAALGQQINKLDELRRTELAAAGVDLGKLDQLRAEESQLANEERTIEQHKPLVERWQAFMEAGGTQRVQRLKDARDGTAKAVEECQAAKRKHEEACDGSARAHRTALAEDQKRLDELARDVQRLEEVLMDLAEFLPRYGVTPIDALKAEELVKRVKQTRSKLAAATVSLETRFAALKNRLTGGGENNVRKLVEETLATVSDASIERRAAALLEAHRLIEIQVVPQVGSSLKLMLDGVGSFRDTIQRFETEVERFNNQLQLGLRQVESFPRLRDLELKLTTDFATLDVVRKVSRLDELRTNARIMVQDTAWLPDEQAEVAMFDFMSTLEDSGRTEVSLASRVNLRGKVTENDQVKTFTRAEALKHVSSTGLSSLVLITLLVGLLNMIRGGENVHVAWITDEIAKYDADNFAALLEMLRANKIDVVTASPDLGVLQYRRFEHRYQMADGGRLKEWTRRPTDVSDPETAAEVLS